MWNEMVTALRAAGCVFAEDEADLLLASGVGGDALAALVQRRCAGEPLEQILGWAEFDGIRVAMTAGVFVPRRRSGLLVQVALDRLSEDGFGQRAVVLDLCCGTGAIGLSLARRSVDIELHAADLDPAAVDCARENLRAVGGTVYSGDLFVALPASLSGRFDLILANAPYVPSGDIAFMPSEARDHEHRMALDGGADGLALHQRIGAGARPWLAVGGMLAIETSRTQADRTLSCFTDNGFDATVMTDDDLDATVVIGVLVS